MEIWEVETRDVLKDDILLSSWITVKIENMLQFDLFIQFIYLIIGNSDSE